MTEKGSIEDARRQHACLPQMFNLSSFIVYKGKFQVYQMNLPTFP